MIGAVEMRTDITGPPSQEPPSYSASSEIRPEEYEAWRNSPLGMITERDRAPSNFTYSDGLECYLTK